MLPSDLFAQRSNVRCSCWKTSNIFQSAKPNRHSCFFLLHLKNRLTGRSHPARAVLFQPIYVYSGKRAVRREYAEIGGEWPAIEIQGKLRRARQKRRCDLWLGTGRWKARGDGRNKRWLWKWASATWLNNKFFLRPQIQVNYRITI